MLVGFEGTYVRTELSGKGLLAFKASLLDFFFPKNWIICSKSSCFSFRLILGSIALSVTLSSVFSRVLFLTLLQDSLQEQRLITKMVL